MREKLVLECIRSLNKLGKRCEIYIEWVKSHVGYIGNELADGQAKQGAVGGLLDEGVDLPKSYLKLKTKEAFYKIWENTWLNKNRERSYIAMPRD